MSVFLVFLFFSFPTLPGGAYNPPSELVDVCFILHFLFGGEKYKTHIAHTHTHIQRNHYGAAFTCDK